MLPILLGPGESEKGIQDLMQLPFLLGMSVALDNSHNDIYA